MRVSNRFVAGLVFVSLVSGSALAGAITFNDLTDTVSITDTTLRLKGGCAGES